MRQRARGRGPLAVVLVVVLVASVFVAVQTRHLWFFGDDWAFLLSRRLGERPLEDLMRPHNEHWSAVPVLIYRLVYSVFGLHQFMAFALLPVAAHAVACVLLFLLLRRCAVDAWVAVGVTAVMAFLGAGAENLLWSFQVGMISSAALGLGTLLVAAGDARGTRPVVVTWVLAVLSLMSSGTAVPMLTWLGIFVLLRRGLRPALVLTVPPMLVYAAWFLVWGRGVETGIPPSRAADVVPLAWKGLAATWEAMTGFAGVGPAIVLGLLVASVVLAPATDRRALALSGTLAALVTFVVLAESRGGLGPDSTSASRYLYFGALMTLPALALVLDSVRSRLDRRPAEAALAVAVVVGLLVVPGAMGIHTFREGRDTLTPDLRGRTVAAAQLVATSERLLDDRVDETYNPDISVEALRRDDVADALPDDAVPPLARLNARAALQVGVSSTSLGLPPGRVEVVGTETTASGDCSIGLGAPDSRVEVASGQEGAELRLTLSGTDRTTVRLRDGELTSATFGAVTGDTTEVFLGVTAPGVDLVVDLPAGAPFTVCGR